MIDVKKAVQKAGEYLLSLYPNAAGAIQLEEVELTEDDKYWLITLSFPDLSIRRINKSWRTGRTYKTLKVKANTGTVVAMKIREVYAS